MRFVTDERAGPVKFSLAAVLAMSLVALIAAFVNPYSALVFVWWGCAVAVGHRYVLRSTDVGAGLLAFAFMSALAIVMYLTQLRANPTYYGFSGGVGVGTDDSYFYSLVAYDLPHDFPRRFALAVQWHNYASILKVLVSVHRRLFPSLHPLDLLFFNTCCLSFLPFLVRGIYRELFPADKGDRWAFGMSLVAPFILANGVILMRDGLVATAFAWGLLALLQRRWLLLALALVAVAWLRFETGLMLGGMALVLGLVDFQLDSTRATWQRPDSVLRLTLLGLAGLVVVAGGAKVFWGGDLVGLLFRGDFLKNTIGQSAAVESGTSTFYALSKLPWVLRIPSTLAFYIGSPFLALGALKTQGMWVPRAFLTNIFAMLFPVYAAWFYRGILRVIRSRHRGALAFLVLFLVSMSLITQASMQLRHKIPLQPMFYVLTAFGATTPYAQDRSLGWVLALMVVLVDLLFAFLHLAGG